MEKIVKTTYKLSTLEYRSNGWQGTAEMDNSEFESFDKAALIELLCKNILLTVIERNLPCDEIYGSDWDDTKNEIEQYFKTDTIISELYPIVNFADFNYNGDDICGFSIILAKNINSVVCERIYLTFEY